MMNKEKTAGVKTLAKKSRKETDTALKTADVKVDFPKTQETITSRHYTIRLSAPDTAKTEISIDGNEWQACRSAVGYWWFDWSGYMAGKHQIKVRIQMPDGQAITSPARTFLVRF